MRTIVAVTLAFVFVVSAFVVYLKLGSKHQTIGSEQRIEPRAPKVSKNSQNAYGKIRDGENPWFSAYAEDTGELKNRFRAEDYRPRSNGQIDVTKPVAEFYMPNHQMMRLIGETGEVVVPESQGPKSSLDVAPGAPSRGQIHTVTIQLFNMFPGSDPKVPDETILTNNVQFDNETMLITTESFHDKETHQLIAADEVPVRMRSLSANRGYDFDGRGLKLRWNDKDGRLDLLEVAHGEWLKVKDVSSASSVFGGGAEHRPPTPTTLPVAWAAPLAQAQAGAIASGALTPSPGAPGEGRGEGNLSAKVPDKTLTLPSPGVPGEGKDHTRDHPEPQAIAAADKLTPAQKIQRAEPVSKTGNATAPVKAKAPAVPVPYVATFSDNVRITQGTEVLITANKMEVDFVSRGGQQQPPTTAPVAAPPHVVEQPATRPVDPAVATNTAAEAHPATLPAVATATPATMPATRPSAEPVLIRWTGKLVMLPVQPNRPKLVPGDSIIQLIGKPVVVRRTPAGQPEGDDIRAAHLTYHTVDGSVKLVQSAAIPEVVISKLVNGQIDPKSTITTSTLDYISDAAGKKYAVLTGPGHAAVPMAPEGAKKDNTSKPNETALMDARWKQGAKVYFIGKGQDQLAVEHIDLAGDVDVKHPQMVMKSEELSLFFEPPAPAGSAGLDSRRVRTADQGSASVRDADLTKTSPSHAPAPSPLYSGERVGVRGEASNRAGGTPLGNRPLTPALSPEYRGEGARPDAHNPTTRPTDGKKSQQELKRVIARKSVHAELAGQNGKKQIIDCQNLDIHTARTDEGKFFARQIDAAGSVHAHDGEQDLKAGIVQLTLKPIKPAEKKPQDAKQDAAILASAKSQTRPAKEESDTAVTELETMIAKQDVFVTNKDGSIATGSELRVTTEGGESHVRLIGAPAATVIDVKKNIITGPLITVEPKQGIAHVIGAGTMHMLQEQADGSKPRPMDITWIDQADMNGPANLLLVNGNVVVKSYDADGTVNNATGKHVRIDLVKKAIPATRPATRPSVVATTAPATRPAHADSMADSMQMNMMKDKEAQRITIEGDAKVISTLSAPDGKVLRQFALFGPTIVYQLLASGPLDAKTLWVPAAGRMFVGDHRPPATQKAAKADKDKDEDESNNRGDTAFQWSNQLIFRETEHNAVIVGDVLVVHQPEGKESAQGPVRINSDRVTAFFEPQKHNAAASRPAAIAATSPATKPRNVDPGSSLQLKHLIADGHVIVDRSGARLFGDRIDYDPLTHQMIAHGTENHPAHYEDPDPKKSMTAVDMEWNTQTWDIKLSGPRVVNPK